MSGQVPVTPEPIGPGSKKKSPWKWVGIGCGVIVLIAIVGIIVLVTQGAKLGGLFIGKMADQVIQALPPDVDRKEAEAVRDRLTDMIVKKQVPNPQEFAEQMKELSRTFQHAQSDKVIDQEEALEMYDLMKRMTGAEDGEPSPAEGEPPALQPTQGQ